MKPELTQVFVKSLFDYNKEEGALYWKHGMKCSGDKNELLAGHCNSDNIWVVSIKDVSYQLARIIFLWHKGYMPIIVDHGDRNTLNNKIGNLRDASHSQNQQNRIRHKRINSTSIYKGVIKVKGKHQQKSPWWSTIFPKNRKCIHLGMFSTEEAAALAYNRAAVKYYGEFAFLNIIQLNS